MAYKKFDSPIRTETYVSYAYDQQAEISILGETEKAYLIVYCQYKKNGYGLKTGNDVTMWIPKSIWDNDKYFCVDHKNDRYFEKPVWLN